jgi:pimeloyl-ACP methyl ester carboxylesterase
MRRILCCLILSLNVVLAAAEGDLPRKGEEFQFHGYPAHIFPAPEPAAGKPWVWYMPTLKGFALAGKKAYFDGFRRAGIALAGYDLGEVRGAPASTEQFTLFYQEMVRRGWSPKPILLGQSRGGLQMLGWAMRHPDKTQALVGIYPVCNLATWGLKNMPVTLADYRLTETELRARLPEFNPLDNLQGLIAHRVPIFVVQGDIDKAVPYDENVRLLKERYAAGGGSITVKLIVGEGHLGSPSFYACPELIEFVLQQAQAQTK